MHADRQLQPYLNVLLSELDGEVNLVDIHTHVGLEDLAGFLARDLELLDALELIDARGAVFPLKEPDGYRAANDHVIHLARESGGRLSAFCRLDPAEDPLREAERCVNAGAVGIKLHPRGEDFLIDDKRLDPVFDLANERRLPVMVHDGVGTEDVARHMLDRGADHPDARLILAHCAILCLSWARHEILDHPNLFIDSSWWSPVDLMAMFHSVPSGQILYGSDVPFGHPTEAAIKALRCGMQAGLSPDELRSVMGGQAERLLTGDDLLPQGELHSDVGPATAPELERVCAYLLAASEGLLRGDDTGQGLELAVAASCVPDDDPNAPVMAAVRELIDKMCDAEETSPLHQQHAPGYDLAIIPSTVARTPTV